MNPGPLWGLLHVQIVVDPLSAHSHLVRDGGYVHLFGEEVMDLLIAFDPLLMVLLTFLLLAFRHACVPGDRGRRFLGGSTRRLGAGGFELGIFSEEVMLHRLGKVL